MSINPNIDEQLMNFEEKSTPYYAMLGQYVPISKDEKLSSQYDSSTQNKNIQKQDFNFIVQKPQKTKLVENPIKPSSHNFNIYEGDFFNYTTISRKEYYRLLFKQKFSKVFDIFSSIK